MSRQPLQDLAQWIRDRRAPPFEWVVEHVDAEGTLAPIWGLPEFGPDMLLLLYVLEGEQGTRLLRAVDALVETAAASDGIAAPIMEALRDARRGPTDHDSYLALVRGQQAATVVPGYRSFEKYYDLLYYAMRPVDPMRPALALSNLVRRVERDWKLDATRVIADAVSPPTIEEVFAKTGAAS